MSKIFEALKKTEGDVASLALPLVSGDQAVPESGPEQPGSASNTAAAPADLEDLAGPTTQPEPARVDAERLNGHAPVIRSAAIHVSVNAPVLPFDKEHSRAGEQYRMARTKILHDPRQPRLIVITSACSGDGKTITAVNLAGALALKSEAEVLLVDADLRRPSIAQLLGISDTPGLADILGGDCQIEDAVVRLEQFTSLTVLPGGKVMSNPAELLDSARWANLCSTFRKRFKFVIIDAPPIGALADYDLIQAHCDGVVMVVRPDHTDRGMCLRALEMVPKERLVGVLVNCARDFFLWHRHDYSYYSASGSARVNG